MKRPCSSRSASSPMKPNSQALFVSSGVEHALVSSEVQGAKYLGPDNEFATAGGVQIEAYHGDEVRNHERRHGCDADVAGAFEHRRRQCHDTYDSHPSEFN